MPPVFQQPGVGRIILQAAQGIIQLNQQRVRFKQQETAFLERQIQTQRNQEVQDRNFELQEERVNLESQRFEAQQSLAGLKRQLLEAQVAGAQAKAVGGGRDISDAEFSKRQLKARELSEAFILNRTATALEQGNSGVRIGPLASLQDLTRRMGDLRRENAEFESRRSLAAAEGITIKVPSGVELLKNLEMLAETDEVTKLQNSGPDIQMVNQVRIQQFGENAQQQAIAERTQMASTPAATMIELEAAAFGGFPKPQTDKALELLDRGEPAFLERIMRGLLRNASPEDALKRKQTLGLLLLQRDPNKGQETFRQLMIKLGT
jgi:hypothetical protein